MQEQIDEFLDYIVTEKGSSKNTLAAYSNDLGQFVEFLADYSTPKRNKPPADWGEINKNHIVDYMLAMKERGYASSTIARKVAATKSFFHFLKDERVILEDPTRKLESPKVKKNLPKAISIDDVERLLAEPTKSDTPKGLRDTALLETLYATGLRVSEMVSLNVKDVDFERDTIHCQFWARGTGSGSCRSTTTRCSASKTTWKTAARNSSRPARKTRCS
ncbi:MAG: site-specific integrase [Anaerolineae bacterium]|nr:site-specific integrase [Anaerolineae bacterium]